MVAYPVTSAFDRETPCLQIGQIDRRELLPTSPPLHAQFPTSVTIELALSQVLRVTSSMVHYHATAQLPA